MRRSEPRFRFIRTTLPNNPVLFVSEVRPADHPSWLLFASSRAAVGMRRRLRPPPDRWRNLEDPELVELYGLATPLPDFDELLSRVEPPRSRPAEPRVVPLTGRRGDSIELLHEQVQMLTDLLMNARLENAELSTELAVCNRELVEMNAEIQRMWTLREHGEQFDRRKLRVV